MTMAPTARGVMTASTHLGRHPQGLPRRRRLPHAGRDGCRGAASVELVLATPLLLLMLLLVVQAGLWGHAAHVARAAAAAAVQAARAYGGSEADGHTKAAAVLAEIGGDVLTDVQITVVRDLQQTQVRVRGYAIRVVPGVRLPVSAVAAAPTETLRPDLPQTPRIPGAAGRDAGVRTGGAR